MSTIAVANASGSAGKTTTVVSLAALLAGQGRRVLIVDGDSQANATHWLGVGAALDLGDVLTRRNTIEEVVVATGVTGLDLLPSSWELDADLQSLAAVPGHEQRLRQALSSLGGYDHIVIDCPGSQTTVTVSALVAADAVVTCVQPGEKEIVGTNRIEQLVADVADAYRPGLELRAIIPCIVPQQGSYVRGSLDAATEAWPDLVTPTVRASLRVGPAYSAQVPLPLHRPKAGIVDDYRAVLGWLQSKEVL